MSLLRKVLLSGVTAIAAAGVLFWFLSAPQRVDATVLASAQPGDAVHGEQMFWAGGCASCHAAPGATDDDRLSLGGGMSFETPYGTFVAPNISSHPQDGIGDWSMENLANAMMRGVSPDGSHYYPAFPYASYARMRVQDVADLHAFMQTLPAVEGRAAPNNVAFPFNIRRTLGVWKRLYVDDAPAVVLDNPSEELLRGQYLAEGPAHCGECHTPRDFLGGLDTGQWMAGAVSMETGGRPIPNITASEDGIGDWSEAEIASLLESGFTPDFDSVGGTMASVVRNMAQLPQSDRDAIAAYLKAIPAHANGY